MFERTDELKVALYAVNSKAIDYFRDELKLMKQKIKGVSGSEMYRIEHKYWLHMTTDERERGEAIVRELVEIMSNIAVAVRQSPLLDDADQREIVTHTKMMRSALYFRRYRYSAPEAIHDDGTVLGVSPAQQEEEDIDIERAQHFFQQAFQDVIRILDLITPGPFQHSSPIALPNQSTSKYRQNTAFIMMWMDRDRPELDDVRDAIKSRRLVFKRCERMI
jgi:hypothetical protein